MRLLGAILATLLAGPALSEAKLLDWADLHGWADDDHATALAVFQETCGDLKNGDWAAICALAAKNADPRTFFETFFRPVLITEFGLDTVRHSEEEQAETLAWHLEECLAAGVAGTTLFAWSDRWALHGKTVSDWTFGLTRTDQSEKPKVSYTFMIISVTSAISSSI